MSHWQDHVTVAGAISVAAGIAAAILKGAQFLVELAVDAGDTANDRLVSEIDRQQKELAEERRLRRLGEQRIDELEAQVTELTIRLSRYENGHG